MVDGQDLGAKVQTLPYIHTCSLLPEQVSYNPSYYIRDKKYVKCIEREGERERERERTDIYTTGCVGVHMVAFVGVCTFAPKSRPSTIQASPGGKGKGGRLLAMAPDQFRFQRSGFGMAGTNKLTHFLTTGPGAGYFSLRPRILTISTVYYRRAFNHYYIFVPTNIQIFAMALLAAETGLFWLRKCLPWLFWLRKLRTGGSRERKGKPNARANRNSIADSVHVSKCFIALQRMGYSATGSCATAVESLTRNNLKRCVSPTSTNLRFARI